MLENYDLTINKIVKFGTQSNLLFNNACQKSYNNFFSLIFKNNIEDFQNKNYYEINSKISLIK